MIREAGAADFPAILALNAASEHFLSRMDAARLAHLHAQAAYHRVMEVGAGVAAFLLAFREGADYDSPNYGWFRGRYPSFVYIDRVVVDAAHRGKGLGARLYEDVFAFVAALPCPLPLPRGRHAVVWQEARFAPGVKENPLTPVSCAP